MILDRTPVTYAVLILLLLSASDSWSRSRIRNNAQSPASHPRIQISTSGELRWVPVSTVKSIANTYPTGANISEVNGDLTEAKEFVLRVRMPKGYKVPLYSQEEIENITILSGRVTWAAIVLDESNTVTTLNPQDFVRIYPGQLHSFEAIDDCVVQFNGHGPFATIPEKDMAGRKDSE